LAADKPDFRTGSPRPSGLADQRQRRRAMKIQYEEPAATLPDLACLQLYLPDARPTLGDYATDGRPMVEARRADAVHKLLGARPCGSREADDIEPPPIEPHTRLRAMPMELRSFLEIEGLRILLADDPVDRLKRFLGSRRGRGAPQKDTERRDIWVAAQIQRLRDSGMSIEDACTAIQNARGVRLSAETARRIYNVRRDSLEVKLSLITVGDLDKMSSGHSDG
jgi:hypothetical protein